MLYSGRILVAIAVLVAIRAAAPQILPDANTQIAVESTPGAEIFLNGVRQGLVPRSGTFVIRNARPGKHDLRVGMNGKHPFVNSVTVATGQTARVQAILSDITGSLEVFTAPGASVELNGKPAGKADASGHLLLPDLKMLAYTVRASASGYDSAERRIELEPDVITSITISLNRIETPLEAATGPAPRFTKHRRLAGHQDESGEIRGVVFQPTGELISWSETIIQWDPETGRQLQLIDFRHTPYFIVSSDLRQVSFVRHLYNPERNYTSFVDMPAARKIVEDRSWSNMPHEMHGNAGTFSPDSTQLAILTPDGAELWNVVSGKRQQTFHDPSIGTVAYSDDGRWLASGGSWSRQEAKIAIWERDTGRKIRDLPARSYLRRLIFTKDNRWLAAVQDDKIELWEVATGRSGHALALSGPSGSYFYDAVFADDNRFLISSNGSDLYVWDVATGRPVGQPIPQERGYLALSPNKKWLAIASYKELTLWRRVP